MAAEADIPEPTPNLLRKEEEIKYMGSNLLEFANMELKPNAGDPSIPSEQNGSSERTRNTQIDTKLTEFVKPVRERHLQISDSTSSLVSESGTEENPSDEACKTLEVCETNKIPQIPAEKKTLEDEDKAKNDGVIRVNKATDDVIEKGIITAEKLVDAETSITGVEMERHVQVESLLSRPKPEEENQSYNVQENSTLKSAEVQECTDTITEEIEEQIQGDDSAQLCLPSESSEEELIKGSKVETDNVSTSEEKGKKNLLKDEVDREISPDSAADIPSCNIGYDKAVADNILDPQDTHLEMKRKDELSQNALASSENKVAALKAEAGNKRNENVDAESKNQTVDTLDISLEQNQQVSPDGEASSFKEAEEAELDQACHTKCIQDEQDKILEDSKHDESKQNSVADDGDETHKLADNVKEAMMLTEAESVDLKTFNETTNGADVSNEEHHVLVDTSIRREQVAYDREGSSFKEAQAVVDQACHTRCIEDEQGEILEEFKNEESKQNSVAENCDEAHKLANSAKEAIMLTEAESTDLKSCNETTNGDGGSDEEHHVLVDASIRQDQEAYDGEASSFKEAQPVVDQTCHIRCIEDEQGKIVEEFKEDESKQNSVAEDGDETHKLADSVKEAIMLTEAESVDLKTYNETGKGTEGNNEEQHVLADASLGHDQAHEGDLKLVEAITGGAENATQDDIEPIVMQNKILSHIFPAEKPEMAETPDEAEGNNDCQSNNVHQESPEGDNDESEMKEKAAEQNGAANDKFSSSELRRSSSCLDREVIESMDEKLEISSEVKREDKEWEAVMVGADSNDKEIYQNTKEPKHIETEELTNDGINCKSFPQPTATGDENHSAASSEYAEPNSKSEGQERQEEEFQETVEEKLLQTPANGETRIAEEKDKQLAATYEITRDLEVEIAKSDACGLDLNSLTEEDLQKDCEKQETTSKAEIEEIVEDEVCEASIGKGKHDEVTLESNQTTEEEGKIIAGTSQLEIIQTTDEDTGEVHQADGCREKETSKADDQENHEKADLMEGLPLAEDITSAPKKHKKEVDGGSKKIAYTQETRQASKNIDTETLLVGNAQEGALIQEEKFSESSPNDYEARHVGMEKQMPENFVTSDQVLDIQKATEQNSNEIKAAPILCEEEPEVVEESPNGTKAEENTTVSSGPSGNSGIEEKNIQNQEKNEQSAEKLSGRRSVDYIPDIASQKEDLNVQSLQMPVICKTTDNTNTETETKAAVGKLTDRDSSKEKSEEEIIKEEIKEVYQGQEIDGAFEESVKEDLSEGFEKEKEDKYGATKEEQVKGSKVCEDADKHCSEDRPIEELVTKVDQIAEEDNIIAGTSQREIIQITDEDTEEVHQADECTENETCKAYDQENHEKADLMGGLPLAEDITSTAEEHEQEVDEGREKIEHTQETRQVSKNIDTETLLVAQTQEGALIQEKKFSETSPNDYEAGQVDIEKQMPENFVTSDQVLGIQKATEQNSNKIKQAPILCEEEPEIVKESPNGTKAELIMEKGSSKQEAVLESVSDLQVDEEGAGDLVTEEAQEKTDEEMEKPASTYTTEYDELKGAEEKNIIQEPKDCTKSIAMSMVDQPMETSSSNTNLNDKSNRSQANNLEEIPSDQTTQFQIKDHGQAQAQNLIVMLEQQRTSTTTEDADKHVSNEDKPTRESERRVEQNSETVGITSKQWMTLASDEGQETEARNNEDRSTGTEICEDDEDNLKTAHSIEALIQKPEIEDVKEPTETPSTDVPEDEMAEYITNTSEEMQEFGEAIKIFDQPQETIKSPKEDTETPASTQASERTMIPKEENPTNLGVILEQEPTEVKKEMHEKSSDSRQMPEVAESPKLKGNEFNKAVILSEEIKKGAQKVSSIKDSEEHTREEINILEHTASETDMSINEVETGLMAKESDYSLITKEVKEKTNEDKENPAVTYKLFEEFKDAREENIIHESRDCDTTVTETTVQMPVETSLSNMNVDDKNDASDKKFEEVTSSDLTSHFQKSNLEYGQNQNWTETTEPHGTHKTYMETKYGQQDDNSLEQTEMEGKQTFEEGKTTVVMPRKQITEAFDEAQESEVQDFSIDKQFSTPSFEQLSERVEHTLTTRVLKTECQKIHEENIVKDNSLRNPPGDKIDESISSQHEEPTDLGVAPRGNVAHVDLFTMAEKQDEQTQHTSYELPPKEQKSEMSEKSEEETKEALKLVNEGPEDASGGDRNRTVEAWMEKDRIQEHAAAMEDRSASRPTHPVEKVEEQIPSSLSTEILEDECSKNKTSQISGETEEKTKETQKLVNEGLEDASGVDRSRPAKAGLDANRIQEQAAAVGDESASMPNHPVEKIQESFLAMEYKTAAGDESFRSQVLPVVELLEKKILITIENPVGTKRSEGEKLDEERNGNFSIEKKIPEVPLQEDIDNISAAQTCSDTELEQKLHITPSDSCEDMIHCKMTVTNDVEEEKPAEQWQVVEIKRTGTSNERPTELGEVKVTGIQASTQPELEKQLQTPTLALLSMEDLPYKTAVEKLEEETKEAEFLENKNQEPSATTIETTETIQLHEVLHELEAVKKGESATSTTSTTEEQILPSLVIPLESREMVNQTMTSIGAIEDMQEKDALKKPKINFGEENVAPTITSQACLGEVEYDSEVQISEDHVAGKTDSSFGGNHGKETSKQNEFAENKASTVEIREAFETSSPTSGSPRDMKDTYNEKLETLETMVFVGMQSIRESNNKDLKIADDTKFTEIPKTDDVAQGKIRAEGNEVSLNPYPSFMQQDLSSKASQSEGSKGIAGEYEKIHHEPVNPSDVACDRQNLRAIQPTEITTTVIPEVSEPLLHEKRNVLEETIKETELTRTGNADNNSSKGTKPEVEGKNKIQKSKEETIVSTLVGTETPSLSDLLQRSSKERSEPGAKEEPREIKEAELTKQETVRGATIEEEDNEEQEGDEQRQADSSSDAPVIIDVVNKDAKVSPKKSHNILSGVGSKVKHSISKVKKAIIGKSSHAKPASPKGERS